MEWAEHKGIALAHIQPGKPQQNAYVEPYSIIIIWVGYTIIGGLNPLKPPEYELDHLCKGLGIEQRMMPFKITVRFCLCIFYWIGCLPLQAIAGTTYNHKAESALAVTAVVRDSCNVSMTGILNFGDLRALRYQSAYTSYTTITVQCTGTEKYINVKLNDGEHFAGFRQMENANDPSRHLIYHLNVSQNPRYKTKYTSLAFTISPRLGRSDLATQGKTYRFQLQAGKKTEINVMGTLILGTGINLRRGSYSDTVMVTVEY